jgi:hypothetical protein
MSTEHLATIERALAMPLRSVIIGPDLHAALTALVAELAALRPTVLQAAVVDGAELAAAVDFPRPGPYNHGEGVT